MFKMGLLLKSIRIATLVDSHIGKKLASNVFVRPPAFITCSKHDILCNSQRKLHTSLYHCDGDTEKNDALNKESDVEEKASSNNTPSSEPKHKTKNKFSRAKNVKRLNRHAAEARFKGIGGHFVESMESKPVIEDTTKLPEADSSHFHDPLLNMNTSESKTSKKKDSTLWQSLIDSQKENSTSGSKTKKEGLEITSMKNMKQPSRDSDEKTMKLIMEVVAELNPEKGNIRKKKRERLDLTNRMHGILSKKRHESPRDFESMLGETKRSATNYFEEQRQKENRIRKPQFNLQHSGKNHFFDYVNSLKVETQEEKEQSAWSAMDWYNHYNSENDKNCALDLDKHFPWSAYDEMISWTEEGKLWSFPVDNEADLDLEAETPFYKHVFLEDKLNEGDWCPKQGPVRSFMSSVITALSSNPFLSVQEKHEHIEWFRDYFTERLETLKNLGLTDESTLAIEEAKP